MTVYLRLEDVWKNVVRCYSKPINEAAEKVLSNVENNILRIHKKKDVEALHHIMNALDKNAFPKILTGLHAKGAWKTLVTNYQCVGKVQTTKVQNLKRDFEDLKVK